MCRDLFNKAHLLPCGHSFCPACVREAWGASGSSAVQEGGKRHFVCRQCQEEQQLVLCDGCPPGGESERAVAVKTCLRCEVSLCTQHLQPHLDCPAFSSHLLVEPLGDLSRRRYAVDWHAVARTTGGCDCDKNTQSTLPFLPPLLCFVFMIESAPLP